MSALVDRIAEVLADSLRERFDDNGHPDLDEFAAHMAEQVAAALQLTEERHWVSNRHGVLHHAIVGWTAVEDRP